MILPLWLRVCLAPFRILTLILWLIPFLLLLSAGFDRTAFNSMAWILFAGNVPNWRSLA